MLNLEYTLTKEEFQEAVYYCNWQDPGRKRDRQKFYAGQLFSYLFMVGILALSFRHDFHPFLFTGVFLVMGLLLYQYLKTSMKGRYYEIADSLITKEGGEETILSRKQMDVSEAGILVRTSNSALQYAWAGILKKVVHHDCFYLFTGPRDPVIVPVRIFTDKNDHDKFVAYLSRHLSLSADFVNHA